MKGLINQGDGAVDVELVELPEPEPEPDEAVVEVGAAAVNRGELRLLATRATGWRPGQDVAGVVAREAADGSGPEAGTRVVAWPEQGGWAQRIAVPTARLATLAPQITLAEGATFPVAGVTALRVLRLGGSLLGRRVLVTGASGGVGRFAVELAAGSGAEVTAVSAGPNRAEGLDALGARFIVHDIARAEGPFHLILESTGGVSLQESIRLIGPHGTIALFGNSSNDASEISFRDFSGRAEARIVAFFVYMSGEPPTFGEDLQLLADLAAEGRLHPQVGLEASWKEAGKAFEALARRQVNGKAVLLFD